MCSELTDSAIHAIDGYLKVKFEERDKIHHDRWMRTIAGIGLVGTLLGFSLAGLAGIFQENLRQSAIVTARDAARTYLIDDATVQQIEKAKKVWNEAIGSVEIEASRARALTEQVKKSLAELQGQMAIASQAITLTEEVDKRINSIVERYVQQAIANQSLQQTVIEAVNKRLNSLNVRFSSSKFTDIRSISSIIPPACPDGWIDASKGSTYNDGNFLVDADGSNVALRRLCYRLTN